MLCLYYHPGYCSMSAHIALREAALPHRLVRVADMKAGRLDDDTDYRLINDKGQVPALRLPGGEVLTESAAVLQYIADAASESGLAPPAGTVARYRLQEWLNFLATELHKRGSLLMNPTLPTEARALIVDQLQQRLAWLERRVHGHEVLLGDRYSVADAHLFFLLHGFSRFMRFDLAPYPTLARWFAAGLRRPAVREVMEIEGLPL